MKTFIPLFLSLMFFSGKVVNRPEDTDKYRPDAKNSKSQKTVLIIGLKTGNITSNYFMPENIAEKTLIAKDSLEEIFSKQIIEHIKKSSGSEFNIISIEGDNNTLLDKMEYKYDKEIKTSDLSSIKDEEYNKLIMQYKADYVVFLDNYYLKYEGGSNLFHILSYNVYNKNKKNIIAGKSFFNTPELLPLANYDKKFEKSGNKIVEQLQKVTD